MFRNKVYGQLKKVPKGKVVTYKTLAESLGTKAYRAVGTAMKNNEDPVGIPCYKVVRSDGSVGSYSSPGGTRKKIELLQKDGITVNNGKIDKKYFYFFR